MRHGFVRALVYQPASLASVRALILCFKIGVCLEGNGQAALTPPSAELEYVANDAVVDKALQQVCGGTLKNISLAFIVKSNDAKQVTHAALHCLLGSRERERDARLTAVPWRHVNHGSPCAVLP